LRINKYISLTGYCSRRETDRLIKAKRITINGVICEPGDIVLSGDVVLINNEPIPNKTENDIYIVLNKPAGITCTAQKMVEGNIIEFVNHHERIFPIGRLDKASEGLILLTNDGDIVNKMMRSENHHEKEYIVKVNKPITESFLHALSIGVEILGTKTKPCIATRISDYTYQIILTQGLNRQIRRMSIALGYKVEYLKRVRMINIGLGELTLGKWRELTEEEIIKMKSLLS
jgi:23S rRNA pseudouridine2604 synthase